MTRRAESRNPWVEAQHALIFWRAAADGLACGLTHRYEWLTLAHRMESEVMPQQGAAERIDKLWSAFLAFERSLASCPEEHAALVTMDRDGLSRRVRDFYAAASK